MANIKKHLDNIKGALFGKDVRSSIHDGIDAINKEVENTTGRQVDLEKTFDQLVINAGNSNAEIVDARVKSDGTSYSKLGDRLNEVDSQLEHIMNNNIPSNFKRGTSFFCHNDASTLEYLINQPSRIENYKRCGIKEVLLTLNAVFDGSTITPSVSYSILTQASELLKSNGIEVGVKVQDSGKHNITTNNYNVWFSEKTEMLKRVCSAIGNPTQVNVANENTFVTSNLDYRSNWESLISELRALFPNTLLSIHTYFSEFYNGTIVIADLLDLLGVNYYPYTSDNAVPTSEEVKKAIYKPINGVPFFDTMQEYCKKYGNEFIISEWGTSSFEYQCKNPATDWIPQSDKILNPNVQAIFMSEACRLFPYIDNCYGMYLWSSNCYRQNNTSFEKTWAWDESEVTINAISNVWGEK